jgi:ribonuclease BN (tRNA processing enzyme)
MRIFFLGVRGSTPTPGDQYLRYGGHTSCLAVAGGDGVPTLILDAGTGLRDLAGLLDGQPFAGAIVLSHLHWDHVQGLPFSAAVNRVDARVTVYLPADGDPVAELRRGFSPPSFPITPDQLEGDWSFSVLPDDLTLGEFELRTARVRHKGGPTVGVRVTHHGASFVYLPDHDLSEPDPAARTLSEGADLLIHDGQFLLSEIRPFAEYGHSSVERALAFADEAGVGELILTHHDPGRSDDELDALSSALTRTPGGRPVSFAAQGRTVTL